MKVKHLSGNLDSTSLKRFEYDGVHKLLLIQFQDGSLYSYTGVPSSRITALIRAGSAGRYFNKAIRNKYSFCKVSPN